MYFGLFLLENSWKNKISLDVFFYSKDPHQLEIFVKELQNNFFSLIGKIEIIDPEKFLKTSQKFLPEEITTLFTEEELKENLPFLIKLYPNSLPNYVELANRLKPIAQINHNLEIYNPKYLNFLKLSLFLKTGILGLWISWIMVYLGFIFFLNTFLNNLLYQQYKVILLLGGKAFSLKAIRFGLLFLLLILGFFGSSVLFYLAITTLSNIIGLPLLTNFFDYSLYWCLYFIFLVFLIPLISVWISYWSYEI